MSKCVRCGVELDSGAEGQLCGACRWIPTYDVTFKYRCPCGGMFNEPAVKGMTAASYHCPFCGRRMEGLC